MHTHGKIKPLNGAIDFVKLLKSKYVNLAVATGGWKLPANFKLQQIGLSELAILMTTANDAISRKEILLKAMKLCKGNLKSSWYFGDGIWDLNCTKKIGMNFIGVGPKLKTLNLKYWIPDFSNNSEILSIIKSC